MEPFSPAQIVGYIAFVLGVTAFLQRNDSRLKFFSASQSLVYALHFVLLGNLPAGSSSLISAVRNFLSLRFRSWFLITALITVNLSAGFAFSGGAAGWLPVISSCVATVAIFTLSGVPLRSVLLGCTGMWLINNILSRSIGGTLLELSIGAINASTILRMLRSPCVDALGESHRF